jgi:DNA-binding NarL/FixJ family response regulator
VSSFHILVADDLPVWRVEVRHLLQAYPEWEVTEACDGREAVQKAAQLHPDIVLLDIGMPILNGLEAAQQISKTSPTSSIVFLTQNNDSELMSAALNTGAKGYVLKVNAATQLLPVITAALPDQSPV